MRAKEESQNTGNENVAIATQLYKEQIVHVKFVRFTGRQNNNWSCVTFTICHMLQERHSKDGLLLLYGSIFRKLRRHLN